MIELNNKVIGSIWVDLEPSDELPSPGIHIMIGDTEARGQGVARAATKAVVDHLRQQGVEKVFSRHLTDNQISAKLLAANGFTRLDQSYSDSDGLVWQNVVLELTD